MIKSSIGHIQVEQANCADVFEEFVASFEGAASKGKTFVRGNVVNPGQSKGITENLPLF